MFPYSPRSPDGLDPKDEWNNWGDMQNYQAMKLDIKTAWWGTSLIWWIKVTNAWNKDGVEVLW